MTPLIAFIPTFLHSIRTDSRLSLLHTLFRERLVLLVFLCQLFTFCCEQLQDKCSLWKEGFILVHGHRVHCVMEKKWWHQESEAAVHIACSQEVER